MFKGKKYVDSAKLIDKSMQYEVADAMDLVVKSAKAKFDETVEIHSARASLGDQGEALFPKIYTFSTTGGGNMLLRLI